MTYTDPADRVERVLTPRVRAYIYRVLTAVAALVVMYGVASGPEAEAWLFLAASVLGGVGTGVAAAHTPTR